MSAAALQSFTSKDIRDVVVDADGRYSSTHPVAEAIRREALPTVVANEVALRAFVIPLKTTPSATVSVEPIQEWEGVVEWVEEGEFGARLFDLTEPGEPEFTAFSLDEVSDDDLKLVVPGGVFYWTIAREINATNRLRHVMMLRFRRLPSVRAARRDEVEREAEWIADKLQFGEQAADARSASS
jgi:hypothetical protein